MYVVERCVTQTLTKLYKEYSVKWLASFAQKFERVAWKKCESTNNLPKNSTGWFDLNIFTLFIIIIIIARIHIKSTAHLHRTLQENVINLCSWQVAFGRDDHLTRNNKELERSTSIAIGNLCH